jgi:hypothetical protein
MLSECDGNEKERNLTLLPDSLNQSSRQDGCLCTPPQCLFAYGILLLSISFVALSFVISQGKVNTL